MAGVLRLLGALGGAVQQSGSESPEAVVRLAQAALEGDSSAVVAARWRRRLERSPGDRLATLGAATVARLTYDYLAAESLYARAMAPGNGPDIGRIAAHARLGLGIAFRARGLQGLADTTFAATAELAHAAADTALEAEALTWLAVVRARTAGPTAARELLPRAGRLIRSADLRLRALHHCVHAEILVLASHPGALAEASAGADLAGRAVEPRIRAGCLQLIAADLDRRGQVDSALQVYAEVIRDRRAARDRAGLASALQWRGFLLRTVGVLGQARHDLVEAVGEGEASANSAAVAWALSNLAAIALAVGDVTAGTEYASRALESFAATGDRFGRVVTLGLRASLAMAAGELARVREVINSALPEAEQLGYGPSVLSMHLLLAHVAIQEHEWAEAARALAAARATARARGMAGYLQGLEYHFATLALHRGDLGEAERALRAALQAPVARQPNWRYYFGARLAEVYARRGQLDRAQVELTTASEAFDGWRATLDDRRLRALAFEHGEDISDPDMGVATVIAALAAGGRVEAAFTLADRRRARELLDQLSRVEAMGATDPEAHTRRADAAAPGTGISASDVIAALPDHRTALLEFVTGAGNEPTTVFVLSRAGSVAHRIAPQDSIAPLIARFTVLLESGADPAGLSRLLGAALLDSVLARLDPEIERLVIVPDGPLHGLPFDALRMADGRYVVERFAVGQVPSADLAVRLWRRPRRTDPVSLLAFADPRSPSAADGTPSDAGALREAVAGAGGLARLVASSREARAIARYAPAATVLRRDAATEAALRRRPLRDHRIVHFATHALVDQRSLSGTALVLAPGEGEDGFVAPSDLARLDLAADLVVLSACRTAGGAVVRGEGVLGLTAPLLQAGARSVAATLWLVEDRSVVRLVEGFYRALAGSLPAGDALRRAKLEALRSGALPRTWAAFTIVGDPLTEVPLRAPEGGGRTALGLALLVVVLAGLAYGVWRRNRSASERT